MRALQIVPLPPQPPDGVGAFAHALESVGLGAPLLPVDRLDGVALSATIVQRRAQALLLHYANYAYERRGCPTALVEAVEEAPCRLVTLFHEMWATGPPWRSSFWLSPLQRRLAARLVRRSHAAITSIQIYRDLVTRLVPAARVEVLPVASTVGEPTVVPPFAARPPRLAVFGGPGGRRRVYEELGERLAEACRQLAVEEILDIGPASPGTPAQMSGLPVRATGVLTEPEVSRLLLSCRFGACFHAPAFLGKSTVFAAYCAHGVTPVVLAGSPAAAEFAAGVHYWRLGLPSQAVPEVAVRAREWYGGHALPMLAARYAELLTS